MLTWLSDITHTVRPKYNSKVFYFIFHFPIPFSRSPLFLLLQSILFYFTFGSSGSLQAGVVVKYVPQMAWARNVIINAPDEGIGSGALWGEVMRAGSGHRNGAPVVRRMASSTENSRFELAQPVPSRHVVLSATAEQRVGPCQIPVPRSYFSATKPVRQIKLHYL